jgi:hypothetical protein
MQTIDWHIADLYLRKTNNLIPVYKADEEEFEIPGEKWEERDLPKKFPELWDVFA